MTDAALIFTALAKLSTRQIAESVEASGMHQNGKAAQDGGRIAKGARAFAEEKTRKKRVSKENYLRLSRIFRLRNEVNTTAGEAHHAKRHDEEVFHGTM